jgi:COMPASS component SWD2
VTSSDDESIHVYNARTGTQHKMLPCKKYGVAMIRFTNRTKHHAIHASKNGWDETLRYLSLVDNSYIRYFKGHRDRVVSLAMCPKEDTFLSASLDDTIRFWDLRTSACQGLIRKTGRLAVAFDPEGIVFAVACATNTIKLYDLRTFDKDSFSTFQVDYSPVQWSTLTFGLTGKYLLASTNENVIFLLDAFTGKKVFSLDSLARYVSFLKDKKKTSCSHSPSFSSQIYQFTSFSNKRGHFFEPCLSPDDQFVLSGSDNGKIHIWSTITGKEIKIWETPKNSEIVSVVRWNPRMMMVTI